MRCPRPRWMGEQLRMTSEPQEALPADEAVYFADAVRRVCQTKPTSGWVRMGSNPAINTTKSRERVNIHCAVCLENFDAPFVEPVTVDGRSATQLLAKIEANISDKTKIDIIWDNARYHRCKTARRWLARPDCRIYPVQLLAYCPHLSPIERLKAVMPAYVTHNKFYATQRQLSDANMQFLRENIPMEWRNFRIISRLNFRVLA